MRSQEVYSLTRNRRERASRARRQASSLAGNGFASLGFLSVLVAACVFILAGLSYVDLTRDLPSVDILPTMLSPYGGTFLQPTRLLDRTGEHVLRTLSEPGIERRYLRIDETASEHLSASLARLTVAAEDPDFEKHSGFIARFPLDDVQETLAEKLVVNLLLETETASPRRTLREWILAAQVTARYGRQQVLEWYLNSASYGRLAYGAEAASQTYFGKSASNLTLAEAAVLVAVSETPALNPLDAPEAAISNQKALLRRLLDGGAISADEYNQALASSLAFRSDTGVENDQARAFTNLALSELEDTFGRARLERGGLDIYTTMDADLQTQLVCAINTQIQRIAGTGNEDEGDNSAECGAALLLPTINNVHQDGMEELQASGIVTDPAAGQILALVGETSLTGESASLFSHPAGTLLTPMIYFSGFTRGMGPATLVWDIPAEDDVSSAEIDPAQYHGPVRLRVALVNDYLPPAFELLAEFGADSIWKTAAPFGLKTVDSTQKTDLDEYGRGPLSLEEAAQAFGVFARSGVSAGQSIAGDDSIKPSAVLKVVDTSGQTLLDWSTPEERLVISAPLAYLMNNILSDETSRWLSLGHPNALEIGRSAGAKLGTTSDGLNTWTVGYTPQRLAAIWMGLPETVTEADPSDASVNPDYSAGIWHAILQYATRDLPAETWEKPAGITSLDVCDPSGMLPTAACPNVVSEVFLDGSEPTSTDTLYRVYQVNRETGLLATVFTLPELVENRVFMVVPAKAEAWAGASGLETPPDQYDSIQAQKQDVDVQIAQPALFSVVNGKVTVSGTAAGEDYSAYQIQTGQGLNPQEWLQIGSSTSGQPVKDGVLATWDTQGLNGLYAIRLLVVRSDQRVDTATIQVTVDNTPPAVEITYPSQGQIFSEGAGRVLAFQVSATDAVGINRIEWYVDGKLAASQVDEPYSLPWKAAKGKHTIQVKAYDQAGNMIETESVSFEIAQ